MMRRVLLVWLAATFVALGVGAPAAGVGQMDAPSQTPPRTAGPCNLPGVSTLCDTAGSVVDNVGGAAGDVLGGEYGPGELVGCLTPGAAVLCGPARDALGGLAGDAAGAAGDAASGALRDLGEGWLADLAEGLAEATQSVIEETMTWWLATDSIDLDNAGTGSIFLLTTAIAWVVLVFIVIWQGMRTAFTRSGKPLGEMFQGLVVGTLVLGSATVVLPLALLIGDELTDWILAAGLSSGTGVFEGQADPGSGEGRADMLSAALLAMVIPTNAGTGVVLIIVITLVAVLFGLFHALMLFLKQTAFPILQVMLPIAAVGMAGGESTRRWLPTVLSSMLAIILYKPIVALILVLGFAMFGESSTVVDAARGLVILALSVFALPVLVKMFTPFAARLSGGSSLGGVLGGGLALAGAGAMYAGRDTAPGTQSASTLDAQTTAELKGGETTTSGSGGSLAADVKAANQGDDAGSAGGDGAGVLGTGGDGAAETAGPGAGASAGAGGDPDLDGASTHSGGDQLASASGTGNGPRAAGAGGETSSTAAAGADAAGSASGAASGTSGVSGVSAAGASGAAGAAGTAGTAATGGASLAAQAAVQAAQAAGSAASDAVDTSPAEAAASDVARDEGTNGGGGDRA